MKKHLGIDQVDKDHAEIVLGMVPGAIRRVNGMIQEKRKELKLWLDGGVKMYESYQDADGKWVNKDVSVDVIERKHGEIMELCTLRNMARKGAEAMSKEFDVPYREER